MLKLLEKQLTDFAVFINEEIDKIVLFLIYLKNTYLYLYVFVYKIKAKIIFFNNINLVL